MEDLISKHYSKFVKEKVKSMIDAFIIKFQYFKDSAYDFNKEPVFFTNNKHLKERIAKQNDELKNLRENITNLKHLLLSKQNQNSNTENALNELKLLLNEIMNKKEIILNEKTKKKLFYKMDKQLSGKRTTNKHVENEEKENIDMNKLLNFTLKYSYSEDLFEGYYVMKKVITFENENNDTYELQVTNFFNKMNLNNDFFILYDDFKDIIGKNLGRLKEHYLTINNKEIEIIKRISFICGFSKQSRLPINTVINNVLDFEKSRKYMSEALFLKICLKMNFLNMTIEDLYLLIINNYGKSMSIDQIANLFNIHNSEFKIIGETIIIEDFFKDIQRIQKFLSKINKEEMNKIIYGLNFNINVDFNVNNNEDKIENINSNLNDSINKSISNNSYNNFNNDLNKDFNELKSNNSKFIKEDSLDNSIKNDFEYNNNSDYHNSKFIVQEDNNQITNYKSIKDKQTNNIVYINNQITRKKTNEKENDSIYSRQSKLSMQSKPISMKYFEVKQVNEKNEKNLLLDSLENPNDEIKNIDIPINLIDKNEKEKADDSLKEDKIVVKNYVKPNIFKGEVQLSFKSVVNAGYFVNNGSTKIYISICYNSNNQNFTLKSQKANIKVKRLDNNVNKVNKSLLIDSLSSMKQIKEEYELEFNFTILVPLTNETKKVKCLIYDEFRSLEEFEIILLTEPSNEVNNLIKLEKSNSLLLYQMKFIKIDTELSSFNGNGILKSKLNEHKFYDSLDFNKEIEKKIENEDLRINEIEDNNNEANNDRINNKLIDNEIINENEYEKNEGNKIKKDILLGKDSLDEINIIKNNEKSIAKKPSLVVYYRKVINIEIFNIKNKHLLVPNFEITQINEISPESNSLKQKSFTIYLNDREIFVSDEIKFIVELPFIISIEVNEVSTDLENFELVLNFLNNEDQLLFGSGRAVFNNNTELIKRTENIPIISLLNGINDIELFCNFHIESEYYKENIGLIDNQIDY
jgi:hypothetical protein